MRTCPNCNREFTPNYPTRKYCCDRCAAESLRKRRRRHSLERFCPNCGKRFTANWNTRKYCSDACAKRFHAESKRRTRKEVRDD